MWPLCSLVIRDMLRSASWSQSQRPCPACGLACQWQASEDVSYLVLPNSWKEHWSLANLPNTGYVPNQHNQKVPSSDGTKNLSVGVTSQASPTNSQSLLQRKQICTWLKKEKGLMPYFVTRLGKLIVGLLLSLLILKMPDCQESTPDKNHLNTMLAEEKDYGNKGSRLRKKRLSSA